MSIGFEALRLPGAVPPGPLELRDDLYGRQAAMARLVTREGVVKCVSLVVIAAIAVVVLAETPILPAGLRYPLRAWVHDSMHHIVSHPAVAPVLKKFQ